jgi:hypothetical protein
MNAVFVFVPNLTTLDSVVPTLHGADLRVDNSGEDRIRAYDGNDHLWLFREENLGEVPAALRNHVMAFDKTSAGVLVIEFYSLPLLHRVLRAISEFPGAVVDNDHGTIAPVEEFLKRMDSEPQWDWRRSASDEN